MQVGIKAQDVTPAYILDGEPVEIEEFIRDNADGFTDADVAAIRALGVGETIEYGGGASASFTLTRVA